VAQQVNIQIDQGANFTLDFVIRDENSELFDFTDYTVDAKIKKHFASANSTAFSANVSNTGIITLTLTHVQTANLTPGRYVYDIEATSSANVITRVSQGVCTVNAGVT
jgi:hypothetical protein